MKWQEVLEAYEQEDQDAIRAVLGSDLLRGFFSKLEREEAADILRIDTSESDAVVLAEVRRVHRNVQFLKEVQRMIDSMNHGSVTI